MGCFWSNCSEDETVELRLHTSTATQHACLETEVKGDGSGTCEEPFKPVQSILVGPPSVSSLVTEASDDQQRLTVDPEPQCDKKDGKEVPPPEPDSGLITPPPPEPDTGLITSPPPQPETGSLTPPPPLPETGLITPPPPQPESSLWLPPPEPETGSITPPPPEPETSLWLPPPEPETGSITPPPPEPETSLWLPPPEPETGSITPPPPEPETGFLKTPLSELCQESEVNVRVTTVSSPHIGQQSHRGSIKSKMDWQDNAVLERPWLPLNSRIRKIPSRHEGDVQRTRMSSPMSFPHTDVTKSFVNIDNAGKLYRPETRCGSNKCAFEWKDNAQLKRPWLPPNSRIRKIQRREEGND